MLQTEILLKGPFRADLCHWRLLVRQQTALHTFGAERLATEGYSELLLKRHGPYRMLNVGTNCLKILQQRLGNSVSIIRITQGTQEEKNTDQPLSNTVGIAETSCQRASKLQDTNNKQYTVKRFRHNVLMKTGWHYVVRWYSYNSKDNIVKPPKHFPKYFVDAYYHRKKQYSATLNVKETTVQTLKARSQQNRITDVAPCK